MLSHSHRKSLLRKALREARLGADLRQIDVAAILSKPQSFVAKVENGERQLDFVETLEYCEAIGLNAHQLVDLLSR